MIKLKSEKQIIIESKSPKILVNAYAGSGKSTTVADFLRIQDPEARKLYITFSKKMTEEAKELMSDIEGLDIRTTYSLAYKYCGYQFMGKIKGELNLFDYSRLLNYPLNSKEAFETLGYATNVFNYWMSSKETKLKPILKQLNVDDETKGILREMYKTIFNPAYNGWVSHLIYLKKWQLTKPTLSQDYDIIVADEVQDLCESFAFILDNCGVEKMMAVGDQYQEIFMFSGQKSGMSYFDKEDWTKYKLSTSFRFSNETAKMCTGIINFLNGKNIVDIKGVNSNQKTLLENTYAKDSKKYILCRTNLAMFDALDEYIDNGKRYYVDSSATGASAGEIKYDATYIKNVYDMKYNGINNATTGLLSKVSCFDELKSYYIMSKYKDYNLGVAIYLVEKYEEDTMNKLKQFQRLKVSKPDIADVIVSNVHTSKGKTIATQIELFSDFIDLDYIVSTAKKCTSIEQLWNKIKEEVYILYVAMTRSNNVQVLNKSTIDLLELIAKNPKIEDFVKFKTIEIEKNFDIKEDYSNYDNSWV